MLPIFSFVRQSVLLPAFAGIDPISIRPRIELGHFPTIAGVDLIGPGLYEASSFETYPWLSGAIAVPPDAITAANFNEKSAWDQLLEVIKRWSPY